MYGVRATTTTRSYMNTANYPHTCLHIPVSYLHIYISYDTQTYYATSNHLVLFSYSIVLINTFYKYRLSFHFLNIRTLHGAETRVKVYNIN